MNPEKIREWSEQLREIEAAQNRRLHLLRVWMIAVGVAIGALLLADFLFLVGALINSAH